MDDHPGLRATRRALAANGPASSGEARSRAPSAPCVSAFATTLREMNQSMSDVVSAKPRLAR